jgi:hypothetical protein
MYINMPGLKNLVLRIYQQAMHVGQLIYQVHACFPPHYRYCRGKGI